MYLKNALLAAGLVALGVGCDPNPAPVYDGVEIGGSSWSVGAVGGPDNSRPAGFYAIAGGTPYYSHATCVKLDGNTAIVNEQSEVAPFTVTTFRITNNSSGPDTAEPFELNRRFARDCSPIPAGAVSQFAYEGEVRTWTDGTPIHSGPPG